MDKTLVKNAPMIATIIFNINNSSLKAVYRQYYSSMVIGRRLKINISKKHQYRKEKK